MLSSLNQVFLNDPLFPLLIENKMHFLFNGKLFEGNWNFPSTLSFERFWRFEPYNSKPRNPSSFGCPLSSRMINIQWGWRSRTHCNDFRPGMRKWIHWMTSMKYKWYYLRARPSRQSHAIELTQDLKKIPSLNSWNNEYSSDNQIKIWSIDFIQKLFFGKKIEVFNFCIFCMFTKNMEIIIIKI